MLSVTEAAAFLGYSRQHFAVLRNKQKVPLPDIRFKGRQFYSRATLSQWINQQEEKKHAKETN